MKVNPEIFKAYDVRGKVDSELNNDIAEKIGRAFGCWLSDVGPVAVGRDMRPDSTDLSQALIKGLRAQGRDVWDIGQVTSEMVYFATGNYKLAGGAVVTASHNPGSDNGIKFCGFVAKAISIESGLAEIRDLVIKNDFEPALKLGEVISKDIVKDWINFVLGFIDISKLKPLKLAVDAGNGMAGKIFPKLEPHVPFEITEMYFELDGTFPNHEANPLKFETLRDIIAIIKDTKLDGGIAFDADGDRAFLIDELGQVVNAGAMSSMLAEYFLEKFPGANIVYDVRNSRSVPEVIEAAGGKPVRTKAGHSLIKDMMREVDAPFGGEGSGHFYFRDNWYADSGLIGMMIALQVLSESGQKLSELRQKYTHYATIPETNFVVHDKASIIAKLKKEFTGDEQDMLDGITVSLKDGSWFNVRASNTESLLRFNAEAYSQETLDKLVKKVSSLINA